MRLEELGTITGKLYEDNALSRISDDEYGRLSAQFFSERKEAEERNPENVSCFIGNLN